MIDLLPVVSNLDELDAARGRVASLGYEWWGAYGIEGRRFCTLQAADGNRLVNAHFFERGSPQIERHLAFRDYLRDHAAIAREYALIKQQSAADNPENSNAYNDGKSAWIQATEPLALRYYRGLSRNA